jgi:hypothetical protein
MEINDHWNTIRRVFRDGFKSSSHYAVATVNEDCTRHVTPIGSLVLRKNLSGFFCNEFPSRMSKNLKTNQRVCVLAVNASRWFWLKSLIRGRFTIPPGVRLMGTVGEKRKGTEEELAMWLKKVHFAKRLKGYNLLWKNMQHVRDIHFDAFEPVRLGAMTRGLWTDT